jgi:uncharacterized phosphosugar-binding protein
MAAIEYFEKIETLIAKIKNTQLEKIRQAARLFAEKIKEDRLIHVMGTGHSHMIAEELFVRAGGIAPINALLDEDLIPTAGARKTSKLERLQGLTAIIWDEYDIQKEDLMVIISNSGRNSVPLEMALKAKETGLYLIAVTSLEHSQAVASRHPSGKKLYQLADLVLDNCVPAGDSLLDFNGVKSGPGSTVGGAVIVNSIIAETLKILQEEKIPLPVFGSQNLDGISNEHLFQKYDKRIRHL